VSTAVLLSLPSRCNTGACDVDCVLAEWAPWEKCSKSCNGGIEIRRKYIQEELVSPDLTREGVSAVAVWEMVACIGLHREDLLSPPGGRARLSRWLRRGDVRARGQRGPLRGAPVQLGGVPAEPRLQLQGPPREGPDVVGRSARPCQELYDSGPVKTLSISKGLCAFRSSSGYCALRQG
jgi:hypothetical protein